MLITPEYVFKDVTHITPEWLSRKGIRALVLDIDNTLTADRSQELPDEVAAWLEAMRKAGVKLTIVSNGAEKRVRPFAEKTGPCLPVPLGQAPALCIGGGPLPDGCQAEGNGHGGGPALCRPDGGRSLRHPGPDGHPRGPDLGAQVILKRKWEKKHWQQYYDRGGKTL